MDAAAGYRVLLPYRDTGKKEFECLYGVVFSSRDVVGSSREKTYQYCVRESFLSMQRVYKNCYLGIIFQFLRKMTIIWPRTATFGLDQTLIVSPILVR